MLIFQVKEFKVHTQGPHYNHKGWMDRSEARMIMPSAKVRGSNTSSTKREDVKSQDWEKGQ